MRDRLATKLNLVNRDIISFTTFFWIVWNEHNNILFKNIENSIPQLFDEIKYYSFWWLKANKANLFMSFVGLGIGKLFC